MARKNNNHLFFTCSLIEYIGRKVKRTRKQVVDFLGEERIERIYEYADVFHCEPIEKVADEFIEESKITLGNFDNEKECKYLVPDYWNIGEVYERLIEDSYGDEEVIKGIWEVYHSWIDEHISDYNTDLLSATRLYCSVLRGRSDLIMRMKKEVRIWEWE